jgi:hypothetical protein
MVTRWDDPSDDVELLEVALPAEVPTEIVAGGLPPA